ncbi:MAG: hypothetical protein IIW10_04435, partial [Spirochaetaceae bacterium]|nr:hypothetical protein [Spirochaetaceae bacterium]
IILAEQRKEVRELLTWESPVSAMRGVGAARQAALASLGIGCVRDLLYHIPRGYQCRGNVKTIAEAAITEMLEEKLDLSAQVVSTKEEEDE